MRRRIPNDVHDWGNILRKVYETQGPYGFAKYQYSISSVIRLIRTGPSLKKMLEYCKDIPDPKDVLIGAVSGVILDHAIDTGARVAAAVTLRSLIPRMENYPGLKGAVMVEAIKDILQKTDEKTLHDALAQTMNVMTRGL